MKFKKLISAAVLAAILSYTPSSADAALFSSAQVRDNEELGRYMANGGLTTPAASTTDLFTFTGSSTKTCYIDKIEIGFKYAGGSASPTDMFVLKRSTAGSGGTSTTATSVPLDSNSAAATAVGLKSFTANPTVGTLVGNLSVGFILPVFSSGHSLVNAATFNIVVFDAIANHGPIVLRGTGEQVAINFNGTIPNGSTPRLTCTVYWREK